MKRRWFSACVPLVGLLALAGLVAACNGDGDEITITTTPSTSSSATATPTSSASATSTTPPTTSPTTTSSATPTATATPSSSATVTPSATGTPTAPGGYASSCAAGYPWGVVVTGPFVCIQTPSSGTTLGATLTLTGYAGGSFENNLVVALRDENNATLLSQALTYTSPDAGKPGNWSIAITVPPGQPSNSPGRVVAYFTSPRDGQVVGFDSIEVRYP